MALIRVIRTIENDVWKLTFINDITALSEADKKAMRKFGEPEINIGGVFLDGTEDEYELPSKYIKIKSDLPYTEEFDSKAEPFDEGTQTKVVAFQTDTITKFEDAFETLRAQADTFTGEYTFNI